VRLTNIRRAAAVLRVLSVTQPFHLDFVFVYFLTVGAVPHVCAVERFLSLSLHSFGSPHLPVWTLALEPRSSRHLSPSFGDSIVVRLHMAYLILINICVRAPAMHGHTDSLVMTSLSCSRFRSRHL
jgi:hypothetical protein